MGKKMALEALEALEALRSWSESAILHAELEISMPAEECGREVRAMEAEGRKLVAAARAAGMAEEEIEGAVWYPYTETLCGKAAE